MLLALRSLWESASTLIVDPGLTLAVPALARSLAVPALARSLAVPALVRSLGVP